MNPTSSPQSSNLKHDFVPLLPIAPLFESFYNLTEETEAARDIVENASNLDKSKVEAFQLLKFKLEKVETKLNLVTKLNFFTNVSVDKLATSIAYTNYNLIQLFKCEGMEVDNHLTIKSLTNRSNRSSKLSPFAVLEGELVLKYLVDFQCYLTSSFAHLLVYQLINIHRSNETPSGKGRMVENSLMKFMQLAKTLKTKYVDHNGYFALLAALHHPAVHFLLSNLPYTSQLKKNNKKLGLELHNSELELNSNLGAHYFDNLYKSTTSSDKPTLLWGLPLASTLSSIIRNYGVFPEPNHTSFRVVLTQPGYLRIESLMATLTPLYNLFYNKFEGINDPVYETWLLTLTFVSFDQLIKVVQNFFQFQGRINSPKLHYPKLLTIKFRKKFALENKPSTNHSPQPKVEDKKDNSIHHQKLENQWLTKSSELDFGWNEGWNELEGKPTHTKKNVTTTVEDLNQNEIDENNESYTSPQLPDLTQLETSINNLDTATQHLDLPQSSESETESETVRNLLNQLQDEIKLENLHSEIEFPEIPIVNHNGTDSKDIDGSSVKRIDSEPKSNYQSDAHIKRSKIEQEQQESDNEPNQTMKLSEGDITFHYEVMGKVEVNKGSNQFVDVIGIANLSFFADDVESEDEIFEG